VTAAADGTVDERLMDAALAAAVEVGRAGPDLVVTAYCER